MFRLIDWFMVLPPMLDKLFWEDIKRFQEDKKMPFITTPQRIGREEGKREGLLEGIRVALQLKFAEQADQLFEEVSRLEDVTLLQTVLNAVAGSATPDDLRRVWSR